MTHETPKQGEISKQINVENEVLVVLYEKKKLNQMTENDVKEIKHDKQTLKIWRRNWTT